MQGLEHYLGDLIWLSILLLFSFVLHNMYGTPQIKLPNEKFVTAHSDTTHVCTEFLEFESETIVWQLQQI